MPPGWSPADLLPGLYLVLLALGLAAALRRWYDPVPLRILGLFVLVPFLLFPRALVGGEVLLPVSNLRAFIPYRTLPPSERPNIGLQGDLIHQIAPWQLEVRRALADGRWPLWNANAGAGMPLLGDPQSQLLAPLVTVAYVFSLWEAAAVTAALRVLMAMLFLFLLLRRQGLGEAASALGGLAYGLAGFLQLFLGWPVANSSSLLPLGLYAVLRVDESGRFRDLLLLFLAVAGLFLGGHPETVLYAVSMVGVFLLARVVRRFRAGGSGEKPWPLLVRGGVAMALAGLAAAPVLLSAAEYLPGTQRAAVVRYTMGPRPVSELWETLQEPKTQAFWRQRTEKWLLHIAAARAYGDHRYYWGNANVIEDAGGFAGSATLLLALAALVPWRGRTRFPQERLMAGLLVLSVLLLGQPPGFENLFFRLPILGMTAIHRHHRVLSLVPLALAYLAACESERWRRGEGKRGLIAVLAAALAGLIAWGYLAHPHPEIAHLLVELRNNWMGTQLLALALGTGLLLVRPGERRAVPWLLAAVLAGELLAIHGPANKTSPRRWAYPVTPPIRFLQEHLGSDRTGGRMMGLGSSVLPANFHLVYGLNDVRIDNPSLPDPYSRLLHLVSRQSISPNLGRPGHPIYDLLGTRYVMTRPGIPLPPPLRPVFRDPTAWIYERPNPLPRLFLPVRGQIFEGGGSWLEWLDQNPNFAVRALVQTTDERSRNWRARAPKASKLEIVTIEPEHIRARASLRERRLLASSVFQDGNWRILVDGEPHPSILVNGPFVAAWLQAGERRIDLVYRPRRFVLGMVLCGLALAVAVAWLTPPPRPRSPD